jgi:hypothetical protein
MPIDIERPRSRAAEACEVAGADQMMIRLYRMSHGLRIGKFKPGGWIFSVLDVAELSTLVPLRALGFDPSSTVAIAHEHLRPNLADVLNNRLAHGIWSLGGIELDDAATFGKRTLYLDQIAERVIVKLELPLPVNPFPRTPGTALRMIDAIFDYVESPAGRVRWAKWQTSAIERGGNIPIPVAAAELGAHAWFLRALIIALAGELGGDQVTEAVRPRSPRVADHLKGVTLQ